MKGCVGGLFAFDAVLAILLDDFNACIAEVVEIAVDAAPLDADGISKLIEGVVVRLA